MQVSRNLHCHDNPYPLPSPRPTGRGSNHRRDQIHSIFCTVAFLLISLLTTITAFAQPTTNPPYTIADRLAQYGPAARARLLPHFERIKQSYPPRHLTFLGIKDERTLQLFVAASNEPPKFLRSYPILAASGGPGPKQREGDRQVPEGIYKIELLNPNSSYHLSMRVSYPNAFDRAQARKEDRSNLGGDIMIHGKAASIGCLAMGDEAAEELFVLAADTGITNITVLLTPVDFRVKQLPDTATNLPAWSGEIYEQLKPRLRELPTPGKSRAQKAESRKTTNGSSNRQSAIGNRKS
jgi:L,D-transpeptidase catalytic domain